LALSDAMPPSRLISLKEEKDGLPFRKALMATAHKFIRTIFAMLSCKTFLQAKEEV